jgi:AcrR family transcriptional regulator
MEDHSLATGRDAAREPLVNTKKDAARPQAGRSARGSTRLNDARSLRSQAALRGALLRLVESRPFEKITLREIASEAGLSYPTLFNHYESKEDLFQDIARDEIVGLLDSGFRSGILSTNWRPGMGICSYVIERRSLWRVLLTTGASEVMRSEFVRYGRELPRTRTSLDHEFPLDLVSGVVASGLFEIIAWWLAQGADYPAETIANMLEALVIEPALGVPRGHFGNERAAP